MNDSDYEKAKTLMDQWEERHNQAQASYQDMFNREREAYERLLKQCERYQKALQEIATSPHCQYPVSGGQYAIGVADGHRCAANTAKEALQSNP